MSLEAVWTCDRCGVARFRQPLVEYGSNNHVGKPDDWGTIYGHGKARHVCAACLAEIGALFGEGAS